MDIGVVPLNRTFIALPSKSVAAEIMAAQRLLIYAAPGLSLEVASALINAHKRLGETRVVVLLDVSESTLRLGYGVLDALTLLREHDVPIRDATGLRISFAVIDAKGFIFSSPPLLVEDVRRNDDQPNAIRASAEQVRLLVDAVLPKPTQAGLFDSDASNNRTAGTGAGASLSFAEIGNTMVDPEKLATVEAVIKTNPVENFDLARVVQVFSAYIQFFEFEVRGAQIQNQTVRLPKTLLSSIRDKATRERIIASFKLVASDSKVSGREVREKAAKIRKKFIHNHPIYGGVILKSVRIALDAEIAALQGLIDKHKQKVLGQFDRDAEKSIEELVKTFWRDIARNPPDDLSDQLGTGKRSTEEVKGYLRHVLRRAFPTADKIVEGMRVTQVIKDLTWATLNEPGFIDWLTKEFPLRKDLQRPFALFRAAQETTSGAADAD